MARININDMSVKELLKLEAELQIAIAQKRQAEHQALKEKITSLAESSGFSVGELFGQKKQGLSRGQKVPPKYMNPDNPEETWTGRGLKPKWFIAALKKYGKSEKLLIK